MVKNQSTMTGPAMRPMKREPVRCSAKTPIEAVCQLFRMNHMVHWYMTFTFHAFSFKGIGVQQVLGHRPPGPLG